MTRSNAPSFLCAVLLFVFAEATVNAQPPDPVGPYYPVASLEDVTAKMGGITSVTLQVKDAPLQSVLDEITKQTGFKLQISPNQTNGLAEKPAPVTLAFDNQPVWLAVRALTFQTGRFFSIIPPQTAPNSRPTQLVTVYDGKEGFNGVPLVRGPFLLIANSLRQVTNTTLNFEEAPKVGEARGDTTKQENRQTLLSFSLFSDPKFSFSGVDAEINIENAIDENGRSLKMTTPSSYSLPYYMSQNSFNRRLSASLTVNATGRRIAKLRGVVSLYQARKTEHWEIRDVLNAQNETRTVTSNGLTKIYSFESARKTGDRYEVVLKISGDAGAQGRNNLVLGGRNRSNSLPNLQLFDGAGEAFNQPGGMNSLGNDPAIYRIQFLKTASMRDQTPQHDGPMKLIIEIPNDFVEIKVPFEFTNLPLP